VQLDTSRGPFAALTAGPADSDLPVVLLVPGWTGSKEDFATLLAPLAAAGRRVVAFDQRGQFETPGTDREDDYTLAALAADVLSVAAAVTTGPVDLVGHSFGGLVVMQAVLDDPLRLSSATLLCSGPGAVPPPSRPALRQLVTALHEIGPEGTWREMREHDRALGLVAPPADIEAWLHHRFVRTHPTALAAKTRHLLTAADPRDDLRERPTPMLVLTGEHDDGWPVAEQADLASAIGAEMDTLEGLGHSPAVEDPDRTAARLNAFFDRWVPRGAPIDVTLRSVPSEVSRARHLVRSAFESVLSAQRLDDAELAMSELVTNAVLHASAPIRVVMRVQGRHLVAVVSDSGGGLPPGSRTDHGRGLLIVKSLVERCGAWVTSDGGTVWFWLTIEPADGPTGQTPPGTGAVAASGSSAAHGLTAGPISIPSGHEAW
jgi:pimeloyl-ACP methyl ester carboxylesterase